MRKLVIFLAFASLVAIGVLFGSINQQNAELNYFIAKAQLRVVDISLLFLLLGFMLGLSLSITILVKLRARRWFLKSLNKS